MTTSRRASPPGGDGPVDAPERVPTRAWVALGGLATSTFLYVTTENLPIGLLPLVAEDLGVSRASVGLLVTAYALVVVLASVPLTGLVRRAPRRLVLTVLLGVLVASSVVSALVDGYAALLAARVVTALSQALFWSVVTPVAAGLVPAHVRGRALSVLYSGASTGVVLGVPVGTWLGQLAGWRSAFAATAVVGLVALVVVAAALPERRPGEGAADRGSAPDRGRYGALVVATAVGVTGAFVALTYITPFLLDVTGLPPHALGPVLLVRGLAALGGVVVVGVLVDRNPWLAFATAVAVQAAALAVQHVGGASPVVTTVSLVLSGAALSALATTLGTRALEVAPGRSDMAAAGTSTAFNVGIMAGALVGSRFVEDAVRATALVGALLSVAALAVVLAEPLVSSRRRAPARATPPERTTP
ncbi:MFS transporter [Actinotalea solisilvae]|uniref:MFS transporter n=1 Tax=Actinotalea solisilvae TaxID=2072922 RepID=UPI0018F1EFF9|nr:MFS transporter [Actinotalea solisilvae]